MENRKTYHVGEIEMDSLCFHPGANSLFENALVSVGFRSKDRQEMFIFRINLEEFHKRAIELMSEEVYAAAVQSLMDQAEAFDGRA